LKGFGFEEFKGSNASGVQCLNTNCLVAEFSNLQILKSSNLFRIKHDFPKTEKAFPRKKKLSV